jgi:hypothetical protein
MPSAIRIVLVLFAAASMGVACSQRDEGPPASPSSAFPTGTTGSDVVDTTGPMGATAGTGSTGGLPIASPGSATGQLGSGTVTFETTGTFEVHRTLDQMVSTVYRPPPDGGLVLVWTAGGGDATTVGIGGASFTGTRPTSATLTLTFVVQSSGGIGAFKSSDGECEITIDVATETAIGGDFRCSDVAAQTGQVVSVTGSFRAEA